MIWSSTQLNAVKTNVYVSIYLFPWNSVTLQSTALTLHDNLFFPYLIYSNTPTHQDTRVACDFAKYDAECVTEVRE